MRSVFVFLRDTTETAVKSYLDSEYPEQREPWVEFISGDPCLYINLYYVNPLEFEPSDWSEFIRQFGGEPTVGLMADVSGRHPGDHQVNEFVSGLLSHFSGAAMDDYTFHLWSIDELRAGQKFNGHPFFDYNGWFDEKE